MGVINRIVSTKQTPHAPRVVVVPRCTPATHRMWIPNSTASTTATTVPDQTTAKQPRRLCVAADGTDEALAAMQWAVNNLLDPARHDIVHLAHIVSDPRTPQMAVDATRGGGVQWSPMLEQQQLASEWRQRLEEQGRQLLLQRFVPPLRKSGVAYELDVLRQRGAKSAAGIGELLCGAANGMWALLVASHGAGILADFGSVAQYCVQHAPCPLVLVPPGGVQPVGEDAPVLLVSFGEEAGLERCARFAADLARNAALSAVLVVDEGVGEMTMHGVGAVCIMRSDASEESNSTGAKLCAMAASAGVVVVCAPAGGLVQELLYGPALGHVLRHCERPIVLLNN